MNYVQKERLTLCPYRLSQENEFQETLWCIIPKAFPLFFFTVMRNAKMKLVYL